MSRFWSKATLRCEPYVPGEQLNQPGIIKLNTNENPYPPSPAVVRAIEQEATNSLNLYPSPTAGQLKKRIADLHGLKKEQVFVGNGSDEVLAFSFMAFFDQDKTIRFPDISYSFYPVYARLFNIPFETVPLQADFTIPKEAFFQSQGGVIFPNPNAPTSIYLELGSIEEIAAQNPNQVVIIDEAYIDFASDSAVRLVQDYENILVIQTMSKSKSLAGLRVGYALGNEDLISGLTRIKDSFNSYTLDRLAIAGAEAAFQATDYYADMTEKVKTTREWTISAMNQRGFTVLPSQTNFIFTTHETIPAEELYERLKVSGILIRYFNKPRIENYVRITIGTDEEMQQLFHQLDQIIIEAT
ncbi:Histidinol-phosphate aminotransferase [Oceanobacillus picturae]|uniref:Histidinol-phosphate aminotransferase n=1 Tax=Oceanobacillus picturae TaxID=171693 RepID=W9AE80_9BACI|nr:histidinol-phosphate transaminase [Oceanobacillus picturae]RIU88550.1 histidinol-phosphate transaminase [Oceanobacillus picturae]CDO04029.1 Histidinol-phosphate aminotransferase [Oceanobacillus picturae]